MNHDFRMSASVRKTLNVFTINTSSIPLPNHSNAATRGQLRDEPIRSTVCQVGFRVRPRTRSKTRATSGASAMVAASRKGVVALVTR